MTGLVHLYRPRRTPLHLLPAWLKILGLAGSTIVVVAQDDWRRSAVAAAIGGAVLASTRPPVAAVMRTAALFLLFAGVGVGFHLVLGDPAVGAAVGLNLAAVVLLSLAVIASTPTEAMLGFFAGLARPFRRWVPPEAIGLAASLMVRSVPEAARILGESRDAARARGLGGRPRAVVVPAGVRIVAYALSVGDAVTARGLLEGADSAGRGTRRRAVEQGNLA